MEFVDLDIDEQYSRFAELKQSKGEVIKLLEWVHQQPHLPKLNELEVMLFYHSCHYHTEMAKQVIDLLYTTKTHCPEFFKNYDPAHDQLQMAMEEVSVASLPNLTPDGNQVLLVRLRNSDASKFNFAATLKLCILAVEHLLITKGLVAGYVLVVDLKGVTLSHVTRLGPLTMKKFLFFLQEAAPIRIAGLHFINIVSFVDKILALMKPFLKAELMNVLHLHSNLETFYKFVPQNILPTEYGGDEKTLEDLKEEFYKEIKENREYFLNEEKTRRVNEQLRPGKPKNASDLFGAEGNFKQLVID